MRYVLRLLLSTFVSLGWGQGLKAQDPSDNSQSPYFFIKGGDPSVDQLPLKSTAASVEIAGVIADVKVTQVYANAGTRPLEAVYIFPGSTRAAVYAMTMHVGARELKAVIHEKNQARQVYEQAKQEGRSTSLLEQHRPNVFQMNVANILPGDEIRVELRYTELLVPVDGEYSFVYPTVVGPRYSGVQGTPSSTGEKWVANPYTKAGEAPFAGFGLDLRLSAGLPIQDMSCPTHKTRLTYEGAQTARLQLDACETQGGNRDFVVKYRLKGGQIQSGLLLAKGEKEGDENFFLLMMQPPKRVTTEQIPPREYVFIMDVSGSMHGFPLEVSKRLMSDLVSNLRPQDRFNLMCFASGFSIWSEKESKPASPENLQSALAFVASQRGGGGTEILGALQRALALPAAKGMSRTFVVATDGYISADYRVLEYLREHLAEANMFAFGIGSSVNHFLIEGMAHAGMGEPFIVMRPDAAPAAAARFREYIASPVLTNIQVSFGGFKAYDIEPQKVPDVLSERPILCFGKWKGEAEGVITVDGVSGSADYHQAISVKASEAGTSVAALRNIWARNRIQLLGDYGRLGGANGQSEITALGLKYGLLTDYTSFVAVDTVVRNPVVENLTVRQPLPMPQGVSNFALGGAVQPTPSGNSNAVTVVASRNATASIVSVDGGTSLRKPADRARKLGFQVLLESVDGDSSLVPVADLRFAVEQIVGELLLTRAAARGTGGILELEWNAQGYFKVIQVPQALAALETALQKVLTGCRIACPTEHPPIRIRFRVKVNP